MAKQTFVREPTVSFITANVPLSALAARWRIAPNVLERELRRIGGESRNYSIELPAESAARALSAARRMVMPRMTEEC